MWASLHLEHFGVSLRTVMRTAGMEASVQLRTTVSC